MEPEKTVVFVIFISIFTVCFLSMYKFYRVTRPVNIIDISNAARMEVVTSLIALCCET